jgi:2-hydroxychromene-2-carboxylate isomerase
MSLSAYERQQLQLGAAWLYRTEIRRPPESLAAIAAEEGLDEADVAAVIAEARRIFARVTRHEDK